MIAVLVSSRPCDLRLAQKVASRAIFVGVLLILTTLFTIEGVAQVPGIPTGLTATPGDGQVRLRWTAPGGTVPVTHYRYLYRKSGESGAFYQTTTETTALVTGLDNGVLYEFWLRAANGNDVSSDTPVVRATPRIPAPTGLTATAGDGEVELSWTAPSPVAAPITDYEYSQNGGATWTSTGGTSTSYTVTGLEHGRSYTFSVRAVRGTDKGVVSTTSVRAVRGTDKGVVSTTGTAIPPAEEPVRTRRRIIYQCPVGWTRGSVFGKTKKALIYELKVNVDRTNRISIYQLKSLTIYVHPDEGLETLDGWTLKVGTLYNHFGKEFKLTAENSVIDEDNFAHIKNPEETPIPMSVLGYIGQSLPSFDYRLYDAVGVRVDFGISCYKRGGLTWRLWNTKDPRVLRVLPLGVSEESSSVQMQNLDWNTLFFRSEWTVAVMPDLPAAPAAPSQMKGNIVGTWADLKKR